jgi:hypothetical protein
LSDGQIAYEQHVIKAVIKGLAVDIYLQENQPGDVVVVVHVPNACIDRIRKAFEEELNSPGTRPFNDKISISVRSNFT